jgi:2-hydroxycyclohexanecarboxyl-CoA dehydrogenase
VLSRTGRIDVLVNNAGWDQFHFFSQTTPEFWEKVIAVNYKGVLNTCYAVLPHMTGRKSGVIVNMASDAGRVGSMGEAVYSGCKAAVIAFSKTLAREYARDNIRVNVVAPGITDTALLQSLTETETGQKVVTAVARSIPLGRRPGQADEISPAVVFLASEAARYITGQVLSVNGGLTMVD